MKINSDYKKEIKEVVSKVLGINKSLVKNKSGPNSLSEWDTLKHLNIILACEEYFNVKFIDNELTEILDIDTINEILKEKIK